MIKPVILIIIHRSTKLPIWKRQSNSGTHTTRMRNTKGRQRTPNSRSS